LRKRERSHGLSLVPARRAKQWLVASIAKPLERGLPGEMRSAQVPALADGAAMGDLGQ